jgi:taurine dioxygenase
MTYENFATRKEPFFTRFSAAPVSGCIGAEIEGLDLSQTLDAKTVAELHDAWVFYQVIFFRNQTLTPEQQLAFASYFGEPQGAGSYIKTLDGIPEVKKQSMKGPGLIGGTDLLHTDDANEEIPLKASVLYAIDMPDAGGDTIWVNLEAAYMGLSERMKSLLEGMTAVYDMAAKVDVIMPAYATPESRLRIHQSSPPMDHPVIRTHPESGRKSLFVAEQMVTKINDLHPDESDAILRYLISHLKKPQYQCRFRWTNGTLAFWDNRSTQHMIVTDFFPASRVNHRVGILDTDRPV